MLRILTLSLAFIAVPFCHSFAQIAASFNVSHMGLQPSDEATVNIGDTIQFIYGGGGPHPMTSGHNQTESPVFFPTLTVTSAIPEAFCTLEEPGTYYFHCATNPMNSNNWGILHVVDPNNPTAVEAWDQHPAWTVWFDAVRGVLEFKGNRPERISVYTVTGQCVHENLLLASNVLSTANWPVGLYIIQSGGGASHAVFKGS